MEPRLIPAAAGAAKAAIARYWLESAPPDRVGAIILRPHQAEAVARLGVLLERHRVALLADDVGLGKTYVGVALARQAARPLVVVPAALRALWRAALRDGGTAARILSYEQLSRGAPNPDAHDLVILDEAHHARTATTRRYARIASLAAAARVLLISATPIHNRRADLTALFALGMGTAARELSDRDIAARTVRRLHHDVPADPVPALAQHDWIRVPDDSWVLDRLLAIPSPVPPRDGGDGGALLAWTLVRTWASTRGALIEALRRRAQRGEALRHAIESGVHPSTAELAAWQFGEGAVQLAFAELLAPRPSDRGSAALAAAIERHVAAVNTLRSDLERATDADAARAAAISRLRADRPGENIVVFTQFAASATSLWRRMRHEEGVAVLTSRGAEVAGGRISRAEALHRFTGSGGLSRAERITLLVSTDLLSEGVSLPNATTVVNLDLPWSPARLAQRIGRARRMGSKHASIRVYTFAPPAAAEQLLEVQRRLVGKIGEATRALGIAGIILPSLAGANSPADAPVRVHELLRIALARWSSKHRGGIRGVPLAAVVRGAEPGGLAAIRRDDGMVILACLIGDRVSDEPAALRRVAEVIDASRDGPFDGIAVARFANRLAAWAASRSAERSVTGASIGSPACRAFLKRLGTIVSRTPRSKREMVGELAERARRLAGATMGVGSERVLGQLAAADMNDEAWLRAVAAFAQTVAAGPTVTRRTPPAVLAAILVVADDR